jgi:hypothetical protein
MDTQKAISLPFKKKEPKPKVKKGYRAAFFTEEEIDIALLCLNTWGFKELRYTRPVIKRLDPLYIKECLIHGYNSELFSTQSKKTIYKIIDSVEEIAIAVH